MNPYIVLGAAALWLVTGIAAYVGGRHDGRNLERAANDAVSIEVQRQAQKTREAIAESIAKIEVKNVYTTQKLEKETVEKPVYRDCVHSPDAFSLLNDALRGAGSGAGEGGVPDAGATN